MGLWSPSLSLPEVWLAQGDASGKGPARPAITGCWTRVCGPPASHSLRSGLRRVTFIERPSACTDASEDSEALDEAEGQGSYVFGLSPQRHLTNLVKESADHVHSNVF